MWTGDNLVRELLTSLYGHAPSEPVVLTAARQLAICTHASLEQFVGGRSLRGPGQDDASSQPDEQAGSIPSDRSGLARLYSNHAPPPLRNRPW